MEPLADRLPLVIGVTGHRDLRDQDLPTLEREIGAIIAGLRRDYLGNDSETPMVVLSSLAEGADRLVARVALAQGALLVAPLPMPLDEYRRDFDPGIKPGNSEEFDRLLAQAIAAPIMPFARGSSLEAVHRDPDKRNEQYRAVGLFIAQHSNVLIALWDGDDRKMRPGGTAEVVVFKRQGIPLAISGSVRASLDASEVGPVIQVVTPRQKEGSPAHDVAVARWGRAVIKRYRGGVLRRWLRAAGGFVANVFGRELEDPRSRLSAAERRELEAWETFETLTALTRQFNREAAALASVPDGPKKVARSLDDLFGRIDEPPPVEPEAAKEHALRRAPRWCRLYAIADTLAQERQAQFRQDWLYILSIGLFAFACFALVSHVGITSGYVSNALFVAYSLGFIVIFALFVRAHIGQHQGRFLDYRAIAEALRVAVYWRLVGIGVRHADAKIVSGDGHAAGEPSAISAIADAYPIKQSNELAWVKVSLRTLELIAGSEQLPEPYGLDPVGHAIARYFWVQGQHAYFRRGGFRHNRLAERLESNAIVLASLVPFVIVPVLIAFTTQPPDGHPKGLRLVLLIISGLLPGAAAALAGYSERLALRAQARQYDRMRTLFERACELLPETVDERPAPLARALYTELGIEAMKENAEWVAIYRQRPIQPPAG